MICLPLATPFFLFHKLCGTYGPLPCEVELISRLNFGNQRVDVVLPNQRNEDFCPIRIGVPLRIMLSKVVPYFLYNLLVELLAELASHALQIEVSFLRIICRGFLAHLLTCSLAHRRHRVLPVLLTGRRGRLLLGEEALNRCSVSISPARYSVPFE